MRAMILAGNSVSMHWLKLQMAVFYHYPIALFSSIISDSKRFV